MDQSRKAQQHKCRQARDEMIRQVDAYLKLIADYNNKLVNPRNNENYTFLTHFFTHFIDDQNRRAEDVASSAYQKILEHANTLFPIKTLWNFCIDGRVAGVLTNGASAGIGGSIRVPGGILREFIRDKNGRLTLEQNSDYAFMLRKAFAGSDVSIIAEVFDSHIGCAARLAEELQKGKQLMDSGLMADVSHKLQMARATQEYIKQVFGAEKRVLSIQTSFDPHTGFMYMGLETAKALAFAQKSGGYRDDVLVGLVEKGWVISSEAIAQHESVRKMFISLRFLLDWKDSYVTSAERFWKAIDVMKPKLLPIFEKQVVKIYPQLALGNKFAKIEREERAMLLLSNAFSGFLHTEEELIEKESYTEVHKRHIYCYPYGVHREEGIKVSEGGYPPYSISMFTVFGLEKQNLGSYIELASTLIRNNRKEGRVKDRSGAFVAPVEFAKASLPLVVQEMLREELLEQEWDRLAALSWESLPDNWETMSDEAFMGYLQVRGDLSTSIGYAINNLRRRMAVLYNIYSPISSRLVEQYLVAMPVIIDKTRHIRMFVPFVKLGF